MKKLGIYATVKLLVEIIVFKYSDEQLIDRYFGINPFSTGIDFIRQNLTSIEVRFWRLKSIPVMKE